MSASRRWVPPLLWAALILTSSHVRLPPGPSPFPGADKVAHFVLYAVLAMLVWRATEPNANALLTRGLWSVLVAVAYGALDELHQRWVPTRQCSFADWLADLCGALAAVGVMSLLAARGRGSRASPPPQP